MEEIKQVKIKKKPADKWKIAFIIFGLFPAVSHLIIFWAGVQIQGFIMSFQDQKTEAFTVVNYTNAIKWFFDSSSVLGEAMKNTFIFFIEDFAQMFLAMYAAYMLYKKMFGAKFIRTALYLPAAISGYMMAMLFQQMLVSQGPLMIFLNKTLHMGIPTPVLIEEAMGTMIVYDIWIGLGGGLIVWFGAMGRIPNDLLEYAKLDGVGPFREFFTIILPLIWPTFVTLVTLKFVGFFGCSGPVLLFTEGKYGTTTLSYWLFQVVYTGNVNTYNLAMAVGWVLTIATVPLVLVGRWITKKFGQEVQY